MFSLTAVTRRSVAAFAPHFKYQRLTTRIPTATSTLSTTSAAYSARTISSSSSLSTQIWLAAQPSIHKYSQATTERLQGLDAEEELSKLATKLKTPPEELRGILTKRLAGMDRTTDSDNEKAEYLDWLLSASSANGESAGAAGVAATKPKQKAKQTKPMSSPKQIRIVKKGGDDDEQTFATDVNFADRADLHANSKRAILEVMGLDTMTEIQDKTFAAASSGRDVLGRARTGTGKTVAFLLPAIERILQLGTDKNRGQVGILVVSPTRELATQIGDQAEKLTSFHRDMSVQVMFGGTNMKTDISRLSKRMPTILVATPGRLLDHMQSTRIGQQQFGRDIMSQTPLVVLDETDRLLDMGFRREISKILSFLPPSKQRQTLLFSATIPPDLKIIMAQNMKPDFIEVDCINDGDAATHTNAQVQQSHVILPSNSDRFVSSVVEVVRLALEKYDSADNPAKVVVFFPTARLVNFFAELFSELKIASVPVWELHSKKSQSYRNRVSDDFRKAKRGVLFTSDVSARGESSCEYTKR